MGVDVSMELRTEKVYTEEKKGPATTQLTFDETYHLPDYLPDFFSVILSRGRFVWMRQNAVRGMCRYRGRCSFGCCTEPGRMNGISVVWREKFHFMR